MITIEKIYDAIEKKRSFFKLDDDLVQDMAIHIWLNKDKYDPGKGNVNTFISTCIKYFFLANQRLISNKNQSITIPLSYFDIDNGEDGIINSIENKLHTDELNPLQYIIDQELEEERSKAFNSLSTSNQDVIKEFIDKGIPKEKSAQAKLRRSIEQLNNKEQKYKFFLINVQTGKELYFNTITEIAEYIDLKIATVSSAFRQKRILKKKWKIIQK